MVERQNPPHAIHFTKENENAIASKLGGPPTPPASIDVNLLRVGRTARNPDTSHFGGPAHRS